MTTIENLDWPKTKIKSPADIDRQKSELTTMLDSLKTYNINTILLQTRVRGDVIYPSAIEPFSAVLTGKAGKHPGYDPLAFAIEECHKRGMQLHAWVVTLPLGKTQHIRSLGSMGLNRREPGLCKLHQGSWYMEPGEPRTAEYLNRLIAEIVNNYNIDGIHLDYIRYPDRTSGYNDHALHRRHGQGKSLTEWRRENITHIVRNIYGTVKSIKPWVRVSCAPLGKHDDLSRYPSKGWNARCTVFQDAQKWLKEGIMDILFPMMYFSENNFYPFMLDWQENSSGRHIAPGLGVYRLLASEGDWERNEITRQFFTSRETKTAGTAIFRAEHLLQNNKGTADFLKIFNSRPALIPEMTWAQEDAPHAPKSLTGVHLNGTLYLYWQGVRAKEGYPETKYNVYKSEKFPVDTEDINNLVATNVKDTVFIWNDLPCNTYWAVTAVNAFEAESTPATWHEKAPSSKMYREKFSLAEQQHWGTRVLIKDVTGRLLLSSPYNESINVKGLPAGCYRLEIMSRKGAILERYFFTK
ncbi:MAG: family 10 glycosylhydrolase [Bacteroidaceae bacterium]|nr:family 10 glycosylhydrolase [Bacteroidaceae bacterium]